MPNETLVVVEFIYLLIPFLKLEIDRYSLIYISSYLRVLKKRSIAMLSIDLPLPFMDIFILVLLQNTGVFETGIL